MTSENDKSNLGEVERKIDMSNLLIQSQIEVEKVKNLLKKHLPTYRQAYSDRTCWLMSYISEIAYIKFNPILKDSTKDYLIKKILELIDEKTSKSLEKLTQIIGYNHEDEEKKLKENAKFLNLKLVKTFDKNGTQAIFLENDKYIFLGFRGTEPSNMEDIKADLKATKVTCETGGKIHSGFNDAFNQVQMDINQTLNDPKYENKPLFITGHSLGAALATIATKKIVHKGCIAACYTFGSPRVGDLEWTQNIKTPIYRIVNAADPVTMLPPSKVTTDIVTFIFSLIPFFGRKIKSFIQSKIGDYTHVGDMRYLTNIKNKNYNEVELLYAVSLTFRGKMFFNSKRSIFKIPADHSISVYRNKLRVIATRRNKN